MPSKQVRAGHTISRLNGSRCNGSFTPDTWIPCRNRNETVLPGKCPNDPFCLWDGLGTGHYSLLPLVTGRRIQRVIPVTWQREVRAGLAATKNPPKRVFGVTNVMRLNDAMLPAACNEAHQSQTREHQSIRFGFRNCRREVKSPPAIVNDESASERRNRGNRIRER